MTKLIYAIRNKATGEFKTFKSKCAWASVGAAKNAFALHTRSLRYRDPAPKFDEQDEYELIELTNYVFMYEGLIK